MIYKIFKDGGKDPVIECDRYGSKDIKGKLHLVADGAEIEVTEKLIVCVGEPNETGEYSVVDVMEPNEVLLAKRQAADAEKLKKAQADFEAARGALEALHGGAA